MSSGKKFGVFVAVVALLGGVAYGFGVWPFAGEEKRTPIEISRPTDETPKEEAALPSGPVSPVTGLPCDNWNRRPIAVMQPVDKQARPVAGFSQADMVFEMPNPAEGVFVTRFMGVYLCSIPEEIGAMRSTRHDYISIASGLDAIYVGVGGSAFSLKKLRDGVIDYIDCDGKGNHCCFHKEHTGLMRIEDDRFAKGQKLLECSEELGYRKESKFAGYQHRKDAALEERPMGGKLTVSYPGIMKAEYAYDRESNSYLRTWGGDPDIDRNNRVRVAPKNIVVAIVENEQILNSVDYSDRPNDPWDGIDKKTGLGNISGRYNNLNMGDPWFDTKGEGEARYYMDGKEFRGTWKKDRGSIESKLFFYDASGKEVTFVPGQIWVDVVVPGLKVEWTPGA